MATHLYGGNQMASRSNKGQALAPSSHAKGLAQVVYRFSGMLAHAWQPKAVAKPQVARDLGTRPAVERIVEVTRYQGARLEHWVSPGGSLREVVRLNLAVGAGLLAAGVCIGVPLAFMMGQVASVATFFATAAKMVCVGIGYTILGLLLLGACIAVVRTVLLRRA